MDKFPETLRKYLDEEEYLMCKNNMTTTSAQLKPSQELVEKMCYAYSLNNPATGIFADTGAMTAAAQVCLDEMARHDGCERMRTLANAVLTYDHRCQPYRGMEAMSDAKRLWSDVLTEARAALSEPQEQKHKEGEI